MITVISPISQSLNPDPEYVLPGRDFVHYKSNLFQSHLVIFTSMENVRNDMSGGYYIQLFSPHGLIRFKEAEIGRDPDTGGQVKYVLELMEHLSMHPKVRKVDLFTRRITDK